uniref:Transposase n=1 Tax=Elaeophora elaphi TaxID=1147741 RepID=A0A0R3S2W5_9BILA
MQLLGLLKELLKRYIWRLCQQHLMLYGDEKFLWRNALRLTLIKDVKRQTWHALKFMLYAVTHAEEGYVNLFGSELLFRIPKREMRGILSGKRNAHVLYVKKLNVFCVVRESSIVVLLWPFYNLTKAETQ